MTDRESNAKMQLTIDTKVVGSKITAFRMEGRAVTIELESGYRCSFTVVEHFDLIGPGKWVFVPNESPGRPAKNQPRKKEALYTLALGIPCPRCGAGISVPCGRSAAGGVVCDERYEAVKGGAA